MKIDKEFNKCTLQEYFHFIDNSKKYTDFNTLGLYRSIPENQKLTLNEKIEVREYAHRKFRKTFDFLQIKDPLTFFQVNFLGVEMTKADEHQAWTEIKSNQKKILEDKRIKHRNFGIYSKHECGYEGCPFDGMMIRQGSKLQESFMRFHGEKNRYSKAEKSEKLKSERKHKRDFFDE